MKYFPFLFVGFTAVCLSTSASALDYKNVSENSLVYESAAKQGTPQFILLRGTPVEVIVAVDKWVKIREVGGGLGWIEKSQIADPTRVIVTQSSAVIRQQADDSSPQVFTASKDVLLDVLEKPSKAWVKVKHRDGATGYIPIKSVWGI